MIQTLLVGLLALVAGSPAQGHTGRAGAAATAGSSKSQLAEVTQPLPAGKALVGQDTSKFGRLSGGPQSAFVRTHPQIGQRLLGLPKVEQFNNAAVDSLGEAPEFDPETASIPAALAITLRRPAAPLGHRTYRTRLVRTGHWASRREAVEILTCTYAGPLVLALLPATTAAPSQVLAGPGYDPETPLRPLELTQAAVLRLCGDRAPQVRAYAMLYNLHFQQADEVARLLDYYNRIAVVINK